MSTTPYEPWGMLLLAYLVVVSVPLAVADARRLRLPNAFVVPGLVLLLCALLGNGLGEAVPVLAAPVLAAGVLGCGWSMGAVGMGDVKLAVLLAGAASVTDERTLPIAAVATAMTTCAAALGARRTAATRLPLGPPMLAGFWFGVVAAFVGWP
ncbi:prepilin peptidase [Herbiconiux sp. P15]|uniref:prepilin peptidase n=1 Tax=Herbiconiux liukaitaii TaxID=3342799 RepID=UPI0035B8C319